MPYYNAETKGRPVTIKDEGIPIATNVASIDFAGAGVTGSVIGSDVTETIAGSSGTQATGEAPSGSVDDSNVTFTLANTPIDTPRIYVNGVRQKPGAGNDYTISGTTITFASAPLTGSNILVDYTY